MSSNAFDIQVPATEVQIAEAIRLSDPDTADTIRRLAFERDLLIEKVRDARREQSEIVANAMRELDPPVCRLQFPDGSVPGNAREAAEGWKRWADEFQRRAVLWERLHDSRVGEMKNIMRLSTPDEVAKPIRDAIKEVVDGWRKDGHSALRVKDGKIETFDPHRHDWCANPSCPICSKEIRPYTEAN